MDPLFSHLPCLSHLEDSLIQEGVTSNNGHLELLVFFVSRLLIKKKTF